MARGGQILGATVDMLRREVRAGMSTWQLDELAESFIRSHSGATPSFKGLYGFPGSVCASINEEIVHGIPSRRRVLKDGDIISIDVGVKYEGYHTDSATTVAVGDVPDESQRLLEVTQRALAAGIEAAQPNNHVGDIGAAIQGVVDASGFSIVRDLVGHGIGVGVPRGAAGAELRQAEARNEARPGTNDRDRADGEHRRPGHADDAGSVDGGDGGRVAVSALRAHGRHHRVRASGVDHDRIDAERRRP